MSKYYGTLRTEKGGATRQGNQYVIATDVYEYTQSYVGSVSVSVMGDIVEIRAEEGSTNSPSHLLWTGGIHELLDQSVRLVRHAYGEADE